MKLERYSLLTRRAFLKTAGGVGFALSAAPLVAGPTRTDASPRRRLTPDEVKARIRGPILSIPTPFTADFAVDYAGVRNMIRNGLANGIGVYELTAGNSRYDDLSYDEIKRLTRFVAEEVGGRGIVIAATGAWWTGQAVDYARYAESVGADAVQVLLPPGSEDGYVEHFRKLAAATKCALVLQGDPSFSLLDRLVSLPSIVSMKEDGSEQYYVDVVRKYGRRLAVFCGGEERRYLIGQPYGSPAYFSLLAPFAPEVTMRFGHAIEKGDLEAARKIVAQYETPLFTFCLAGPRSFHAYWRALLEHFGVAYRYLRPPEDSCTDEDMRKVAALCDRLGLTRRKNHPAQPL